MKTLILLSLLLGAPALPGQQAAERVWTDELGRSTRAKLIKVEGDTAILLLRDGREASFPIGKLSGTDQAFIGKFQAETAAMEEEEKQTPAADLNFNSPWPDRVTFEGDPEIATVTEDADTKKFVYESANYRYNCDVRLSKSVVKGFAVLFEATHQFVRELPLAVNGGKKNDGKYQIILFENYSDYIEAGAPTGSAGVFIGGRNIVMVPLTSLGVRPVGSGYMLDRDKSSKTLPHELVHQLTPGRYYAPGSMGWFTEGLAEYVAATPYRSGSFNVKLNFKPIVEYVTAYGSEGKGGRALGSEINLGSLEKFMLLPYEAFTGDAQINYGSGLLITNYLFHMDGNGDGARIKAFLKALRDGKVGQEAIDVLLDGQTYEDLEKEIAKAYSRKGVDFTFSD